MTPTFPAMLAGYCLLDELEKGSLSTTYLGTSMADGGASWLIVKVLHPHFAADPVFRAMFMDDARMSMAIRHPNVVQGFDAGQEGDAPYLVLEYVHGPSLPMLTGSIEIPAVIAASICADIAEGLHAANSMCTHDGEPLGLVHRNVSPATIAVTHEGVAKLSGFEIIKAAHRLAPTTRAGLIKGSLAYMSPEQVRGAEIDHTTDVFALGIVLWELSTHQRLFRMDTDLDTLEKVQACAVPPPTSIVGGYPPELERIVMKALAKRQRERFQTALELAEALRGFLLASGAADGSAAVSHFICEELRGFLDERDARLARAGRLAASVLQSHA